MPAFADLPSREKEAKLRELAQQTLGIRIFNKAQQLQSACVCACVSVWLRPPQQLVSSEACLTVETERFDGIPPLLIAACFGRTSAKGRACSRMARVRCAIVS